MESSLARYIWKYSRRQQMVVVLLTFASFPILYLTLEIPKWIINEALGDPESSKTFLGMSFEPVDYLIMLCFLLLGLIVVNGVIKMRINTMKGIIGERLVRRMRYTLIQNILRFPLPYFSRISSGEMISTVTAETEPLGGYIGESYALPLFQGGTMITILIFMFAQDVVFGLASVALIPVQGYIIPKLQQQVNALKKERVRHVRKLSERIGETVSGATEIRLHGTQPYTLSEFSRRLGDLFAIRLDIFRKKFFMKFLNNTIGQITPFTFYLFGGYLVIKGDLTIGALVAAIGAYKDLTSPWRELLNFYQLHEDSKIKFQQIKELFFPDDLVKVDEVETEPKPVHLEGDLRVEDVTWRNENGEQILTDINLRIPRGESIAITGDFPVRRNRLAQLLSGLETPETGRILIGDTPMRDIPDSVLRRRLSLQGPDPHLFVGTIVENVEYGLQQYEPDVDDDSEEARLVREAKSAGNRAPIDTGWLDYRQADHSERSRSPEWYYKVLSATGSEAIVYERSLLEVFDPQDKPDLATKLLDARRRIRDILFREESEYPIVEPFDPDTFNRSASISENLLFGVPVDDRLDTGNFLIHDYFLRTLDQEQLEQAAIELGLKTGKTLLAMLDDNTLSQSLRHHFGLDDEERIDRIRYTVENFVNPDKLSRPCYCLLISLFLQIVPERHSFVQISARLATRLLQARREFADNLPEGLADAVERFEEEHYHSKLAVIDNLLFGRVASRNPASERRVRRIVSGVVDDLDLRKDLMLLLSESQVGISGSRLPLIARHRISLGRALVKKPDILILHDALAPMDGKEQAERRQAIRELLPDVTMICIARDVAEPDDFDRFFRITEEGGLLETTSANELIEAEEDGEDSNEKQTRAKHPGKRSSNRLELVSTASLFSGLSASQRRNLADSSDMISVPEGSTLYSEGDEASSAWLVVSGSVDTINQDGDPVGRFKRPEVFGAIEVLADTRRILTAKATSDSMLLRIDADAIENVALSDAKVSRTMLRALTEQWRR